MREELVFWWGFLVCVGTCYNEIGKGAEELAGVRILLIFPTGIQ